MLVLFHLARLARRLTSFHIRLHISFGVVSLKNRGSLLVVKGKFHRQQALSKINVYRYMPQPTNLSPNPTL